MSISSVDLPPPDTPVTQVNRPSGISAVMFFRLLPRAPTTFSTRGGFLRAPLRHRDFAHAVEILAGQRIRVGHDVGRRAFGDDAAAMDAGAGADIDHVIGGADGVLVVLDHDHGVAEVAQPLQRFQQPRIVALVQADRRLVEHVEHAGQAGADLRGEPDALALAAGQRAGGARERQVIEPDIDQEFQPRADFLEDAHGDFVLLGVELVRQFGEPGGRRADRQIGDFADVLAGDLARTALRA